MPTTAARLAALCAACFLSTACGGDEDPNAGPSGTSASSGPSGSGGEPSTGPGGGSAGGAGGGGGEAPYYVLEGIDPLLGLPYDDLQPLLTLLGDASVVGLGESFHNLKSLFQAKSRLIRFLIEEGGFRVLTLEAGWGEVEAIDAYVQTCSGTPEGAVDALFWTNWHDHVLADLFAWLCEYNQSHADDPVRIYGFDTQQLGQSYARDRLFDYLTATATPGEAAELTDDLDMCAPAYLGTSIPAVPEDMYDACLVELDGIDAWLSSHRSELTGRDATAFAWATVALATLRAWEDQVYFRNDGTLNSQNARDRGMADVFMRIKAFAFPSARAITWAHNFHVMADSSAVENDFFNEELGPLPWPVSMGSHLEIELGEDHYPLGMFVRDVDDEFLAEGASDANCDNCLEQLIHGEGHAHLFMGSTSPLLEPGHVYTSVFNGFQYDMVPAAHFEGLVYIEQSEYIDAFTGNW